jgi:hypothetical protein
VAMMKEYWEKSIEKIRHWTYEEASLRWHTYIWFQKPGKKMME